MQAATQREGDLACCMKALRLEKTSLQQGGAAVRFSYESKARQCRVDREMFLNLNLDSSGGLPHVSLNLCGDEKEHYYFRHASGGADGSNLKTGGKCIKSTGFKKFTGGDKARTAAYLADQPMGKLAHGWGLELPNHGSKCPGEGCNEVVRYNAISDLEECCEACNELRMLQHTPEGGNSAFKSNPCVAFQIVSGKCMVVRDGYFGANGKFKGTGSSGHVEQYLDGVKSSSCSTTAATQSQDNCNYFSNIFYKEDATTVDAAVIATSNKDKANDVSFTADLELLSGLGALDKMVAAVDAKKGTNGGGVPDVTDDMSIFEGDVGRQSIMRPGHTNATGFDMEANELDSMPRMEVPTGKRVTGAAFDEDCVVKAIYAMDKTVWDSLQVRGRREDGKAEPYCPP